MVSSDYVFAIHLFQEVYQADTMRSQKRSERTSYIHFRWPGGHMGLWWLLSQLKVAKRFNLKRLPFVLKTNCIHLSVAIPVLYVRFRLPASRSRDSRKSETIACYNIMLRQSQTLITWEYTHNYKPWIE